MRRSFLLIATGAISVAICSPAVADDLFLAPAVVVAESDGSFAYTWKFYKFYDPATLAGAGWNPVENVTGGLSADCFCTPSCVLAQGDSVIFQVSGQVQLLPQDGLVRNWISFCDASDHEAITRVRPFGTTGVGESPGGSLSFWNGPNPFSTEAVFHYVLPEEGDVALRIHDLSGRAIATLWEGAQPAGRHSFTWNARAGAATATGVLFARLTHRGRVVSRSIVFLR